MFVDNVTLNTLVVAMDIQKARQTAAAYNVANYSRGDVPMVELAFDSLLSELSSADSDLVSRQVLAKGVESYASIRHQDAATVSMEELIMASEKAESRYKTTAEILDRQLAMVRLAVKGS